MAQRESGRRLGERLTDTTFWRNEVATELENMLAETSRLQDTRRALEKAIQDCEPPLHIAQENLYHREGRQGIDLVHDQVSGEGLGRAGCSQNVSRPKSRPHAEQARASPRVLPIFTAVPPLRTAAKLPPCRGLGLGPPPAPP